MMTTYSSDQKNLANSSDTNSASTHEKDTRLYAGFEAGGTKFNCVLGRGSGKIVASQSFPTTTPEETLGRVKKFFDDGSLIHGPISAIGIGQFGPVDINPKSNHYGSVRATPKPYWSYTDVLGYFSQHYDVPVAFDTDVNMAAVGEHYFGNAGDVENFVYVTVGTGIGVSIFSGGRILKGKSHPETGHMLVPQDKALDSFPGVCPFHRNCLEGLASGKAIGERWGASAETLSADHPAWAMQAAYLGAMCVNLDYLYAPEKIVLGGGVMNQKHLYPLIREEYRRLNNDYFLFSGNESCEDLIVPSTLRGRGAEKAVLVMAQKALFQLS